MRLEGLAAASLFLSSVFGSIGIHGGLTQSLGESCVLFTT